MHQRTVSRAELAGISGAFVPLSAEMTDCFGKLVDQRYPGVIGSRGTLKTYQDAAQGVRKDCFATRKQANAWASWQRDSDD